MEQIFIDRFKMPQAAKSEFIERMQINRNFISKLTGFVRDEVFESQDDDGNFLCVTIAVWADEAVLKKAKELVQAEYLQRGFNMPAMMERLSIKMERGQYSRFEH